ncbi:MAG: N-acetylmuramoyl-L-alanine amidase [Sandaracinaceae bacterium]
MRFVDDGDGRSLLEAEVGERVVHFQNPKTDERRHGKPVGVVLHYTAVRARPRPASDLAHFRPLLSAEPAQTVDKLVGDLGSIPSGLALSLQNARRATRRASWDFLIERSGLVVQCNTRPSSLYTWHAGRSLSSFARRGRDVHATDAWTGERTLVYDHSRRGFVHPVLPDRRVPINPNPYVLGIEVESWGKVVPRRHGYYQRYRKDGQVHFRKTELGIPDVERIGSDTYERISAEQHAALLSLARAIVSTYGIAPEGWLGHREIRPDNRVDPEPPLRLRDFVEEVYDTTPETGLVALGEDDLPAGEFDWLGDDDRGDEEPPLDDGRPS